MILLDTHAWIWWASKSPKLPSRVRSRLDKEDSLFLSAVSCWELSTLVRKGRLKLDRDVGLWIQAALYDQPRIHAIAITPEVATVAGALDPFHGDPADRVIAATSIAWGIPVATKDHLLQDAPMLQTVW